MIRPQKKKEKETKNMQSNIQIGDEIVTIGGIVGLVIRKGEDNVVIETGGEKNKMRIKLWAISENTSALERAKAAQAEKKAGLSAGKLKDDESGEKKSKKKKDKDDE
jgi:preprotein translocase subunit YajC